MSDGSRFLIPLNSQRYRAAFDEISKRKPNFLIDFGCNECDFLFYIAKNPRSIRFLIGVDKDPNVIEKGHRAYLRTTSISYKNPRFTKIYLANEDIANLSDTFIRQYRYCPFVTMLELIEHLEPADVDKAVDCIFNKLYPQCVFLTTPNIEYNSLLEEAYGNRKSKFRHPDHRFEFTRSQFSSWVSWICERYKYASYVRGIGTVLDVGDDGSKGFASHSVLFIRSNPVPRKYLKPEVFLFEVSFESNKELYDDDDSELE